MSLFAVTSTSLSSSMIQPLSGWPDLTPSTTTTPTPSPSSCTTKWIMPLFYSHGPWDRYAPTVPASPRLAGCIGRDPGARAVQSEAEVRGESVHARRGERLPAADGLHALDAPRAVPGSPRRRHGAGGRAGGVGGRDR